jgi:hypothetical protein
MVNLQIRLIPLRDYYIRPYYGWKNEYRVTINPFDSAWLLYQHGDSYAPG